MINIWLIDRTTGLIKSFSRCNDFEINRDYLLDNISVFNLLDSFQAEKDDFILVKETGTQSHVKPLYFGVIESIENNNVYACDIYHIFRDEQAIFKIENNQTYYDFLTDLVTFIANDNLKLFNNINFIFDDSLKSKNIVFVPNGEYADIMRFTDFLIYLFKKDLVTCKFDSLNIENINKNKDEKSNKNNNEGNKITINIIFKIENNTINLKNNNNCFFNWSIENKKDKNITNSLAILCGQDTSTSLPSYSYYYLRNDNTITTNPSDPDIKKPIIQKVFNNWNNKNNNDDIANSELYRQEFNHQITFDVKNKNNKIFDLKNLSIGLISNIFYNDQTYKSVLTGYTLNDKNDFISLKFGLMRNKLKMVLN